MYTIFILLHVLICVSLIISVLLQSAKGEGLAGAFGGSSLTGTVFGGRGAATFLSKATTILAIAFMASSILLTFISPATGVSSAVSGESAVQEAVQGGQVPAPQQPATTTPATTGGDQGGTAQPPSEPGSDIFDNGTEGAQQPKPGQQPASGEQPSGGEQPAQQQQTPPEGGGGK